MADIACVGAHGIGTNGQGTSFTSAGFGFTGTDLVILLDFAMACDANVQITSVTDNGPGLTWQRRYVFNMEDDQSVFNVLECWWAYAPAGIPSGTTITVTNNGAVHAPNTTSCLASAFTNVHPTSPFTTATPGFDWNPSTSTADAPNCVFPNASDYLFAKSIWGTRQSGINLANGLGEPFIADTGEEPAVGQNRTSVTLSGAAENAQGVTGVVVGSNCRAWYAVTDGLINFTPPPPPPPPKTFATSVC